MLPALVNTLYHNLNAGFPAQGLWLCYLDIIPILTGAAAIWFAPEWALGCSESVFWIFENWVLLSQGPGFMSVPIGYWL